MSSVIDNSNSAYTVRDHKLERVDGSVLDVDGNNRLATTHFNIGYFTQNLWFQFIEVLVQILNYR
jgi:hypothetical protein